MIKYLRISEMMCGFWKLCLLLFLLVVGVLHRAFVFLFVSSSAIILTRKGAGCFTLICVPCPFFKVQWVSQESVIVTFPSHVHLEKEDVCWQFRQHHSFMNI